MSSVDVVMPSDSQEGTTSILGKWLKNTGDSVRKNEPLIEISTDKVVVEIASPCDGILEKMLVAENQAVEKGQVLGKIKVTAVAQDATEISKTKSSPSTPGAVSPAAELSPAVKKLLAQYGLNAQQIKGSGSGGRITAQDVENFVQSKPSSSSTTSKKVPHSPMRIQIAKHMQESLKTAPHVTSVFELDMSRVIADRESKRTEFEQSGCKLTLTAYFVRAAAKALQVVPEVNSRWHDDGLEIFADCNIGIGTALPDGGLIVPVIRKAQTLSLLDIAQQLDQLTFRARENKLHAEDLQGGTFTISNHGVSGSLLASPIIINQPQSAILGIGKLEKRVVVEEAAGKEIFKAKPMLYVTLTIDHRVLDGYKANQFLQEFCKSLQGL